MIWATLRAFDPDGRERELRLMPAQVVDLEAGVKFTGYLRANDEQIVIPAGGWVQIDREVAA